MEPLVKDIDDFAKRVREDLDEVLQEYSDVKTYRWSHIVSMYYDLLGDTVSSNKKYLKVPWIDSDRPGRDKYVVLTSGYIGTQYSTNTSRAAKEMKDGHVIKLLRDHGYVIADLLSSYNDKDETTRTFCDVLENHLSDEDIDYIEQKTTGYGNSLPGQLTKTYDTRFDAYDTKGLDPEDPNFRTIGTVKVKYPVINGTFADNIRFKQADTLHRGRPFNWYAKGLLQLVGCRDKVMDILRQYFEEYKEWHDKYHAIDGELNEELKGKMLLMDMQ